jgi:hypothetical protein
VQVFEIVIFFRLVLYHGVSCTKEHDIMGRLKIFLTNLGKYNEGCLMGEWVKLPVPEDKLEAVKHRIGINER